STASSCPRRSSIPSPSLAMSSMSLTVALRSGASGGRSEAEVGAARAGRCPPGGRRSRLRRGRRPPLLSGARRSRGWNTGRVLTPGDEIRNLLGRYTELVDAGDWDRLGALFADGALATED